MDLCPLGSYVLHLIFICQVPVYNSSILTTQVKPDYICNHFEAKPPTQQICKLPCPEDCIMTQLSDWTSCESCDIRNQTRSRTILSLPSGGGKNCSDITQTRPCNHGNRCRNNKRKSFRYKIGAWSKCTSVAGKRRRQIREYLALLGEQTRKISCVDHVGTQVEER